MMRVMLVGAVMLGLAEPALAKVSVSGSFTTSQACPALQSIRKQTNPGTVMTQPGHTYLVTSKNKDDATYVLLTIEGVQPAERWVSVGCGQMASGAVSTPGMASAPGSLPATLPSSLGGSAATHVLALGWEPAFCRQHRDKAECMRETAQSPEAKQLSLHGLWPQPRGKAYCGVDRAVAAADRDHDWGSLPEPSLSPATRQRLGAVMPGLQSGLERHEWTVHGTCFGGTADAYFNRAAELVEQVNASAVRGAFVERIGGMMSADEIRAAFDQAFGPGAGARVLVSCPGRGSPRLVGEIVVSLAGDVAGSANLGDLIRAAPPVGPGCPSGLIAAAR